MTIAEILLFLVLLFILYRALRPLRVKLEGTWLRWLAAPKVQRKKHDD